MRKETFAISSLDIISPAQPQRAPCVSSMCTKITDEVTSRVLLPLISFFIGRVTWGGGGGGFNELTTCGVSLAQPHFGQSDAVIIC